MTVYRLPRHGPYTPAAAAVALSHLILELAIAARGGAIDLELVGEAIARRRPNYPPGTLGPVDALEILEAAIDELYGGDK